MTISGFFGDEDALLIEINLITSDGLELPVEAMFDTGFSYWLAINEQDDELFQIETNLIFIMFNFFRNWGF